jgi:hypothetical protein
MKTTKTLGQCLAALQKGLPVWKQVETQKTLLQEYKFLKKIGAIGANKVGAIADGFRAIGDELTSWTATSENWHALYVLLREYKIPGLDITYNELIHSTKEGKAQFAQFVKDEEAKAAQRAAERALLAQRLKQLEANDSGH